MGLKNIFIDLLGRIFDRSTGAQVQIDIEDITTGLATKELAVTSAINLIGNALAMSKFETYSHGEKTTEKDFYMLNVRPNQNQSAAEFWKKVISKLFLENECLIIKKDERIFVADSYTRNEFAFYENTYSSIIIDDFALSATYTESQVIHLKNHDRNVSKLIASLYMDYGKLIEYAKTSYKRNNAKRGILKVPTNYPQTEQAQEKLQDILNTRIKKFYEAEGGAVLPLTNGLEYEELSKDSYKNGTDSRDIKNLTDDIYDFVARAFQVPPGLIKGTGSELGEQVKAFIALCIDPLAQTIEDELNAKMYDRDAYFKHTYVRVSTERLKASNLSDVANLIDILTRNGVHSIDENRELIGKEPLRTEESQKHYVTKNYDATQDK